ncbi:dinitrogenase iron-molybdenum cofactor biosynthesis protein [Aquisphaera insulae]|uniref:dinitrogenase iron-molybdenum cofactor biosynthesis protein n=1 Tax=Aquisphaera insulae TaxID=2712864 RepID=UPI0013EB9E30|nr:dinitrogenase iron-molybdenum cofactor biosynthesis protein [Aquisphaera insulae]
MSLELSRDLALRIGMAARALPDVSVGQLMKGLVGQLGWPLDQEKLGRLTVTQLRNALSQGGSIDADVDLPTAEVADRYDVDLLKEVVATLWGDKSAEDGLPEIDAYEDGDMPGSIRAAVSSDSAEELDAHFGSARRYLIYQLSPAELRLIDIRTARGAQDADDPSAFRARLIDDCHVLFVRSIGGPAAAKVINAGVYPLKYTEGGPARPYLEELRRRMGSSPPPWLAKAMNVPLEDRIRYHVEAGS